MADKNTPDTSTPATGDGTPSATPKAPIPNAAAEPVTQGAAPAADPVLPPLPADYEMPDDYADQDPLAKAKQWVEDHPGLAVLAAAGVGIVAGRLVMAVFPDPEPPSLAERVEKRAHVLQKEAKKRSKVYKKEAAKKGKVYKKEAAKKGKVYKKEALAFADDAGETLQDTLHRASEALRDAADQAGDVAEEGYEKTKDLAETISDAAKVAVTGVLASKIDDWVSKVRD